MSGNTVMSPEIGQNINSDLLGGICLRFLHDLNKRGLGTTDSSVLTFAQNEHLFLSVFNVKSARVFYPSENKLVRTNMEALKEVLEVGKTVNFVNLDSGEIIKDAFKTSAIVDFKPCSSIIDYRFLTMLTINDELDKITQDRLRHLQTQWKLELDICGYGIMNGRDAFFTPTSIRVVERKHSGYPTNEKTNKSVWDLLYWFSFLYHQFLIKQGKTHV